jgi:hypothetical protein
MSGVPAAKRARTTAAAKGKGKAAAGGAGASAADDAPSVASLVARLERGALEALLVEAVTSATAPTLAALTAALPAHLRARSVGVGAVGAETRLVSTGPFAALSADETLAIFNFLPLKDKLTVLIEARERAGSVKHTPTLMRTTLTQRGRTGARSAAR